MVEIPETLASCDDVKRIVGEMKHARPRSQVEDALARHAQISSDDPVIKFLRIAVSKFGVIR